MAWAQFAAKEHRCQIPKKSKPKKKHPPGSIWICEACGANWTLTTKGLVPVSESMLPTQSVTTSAPVSFDLDVLTRGLEVAERSLESIEVTLRSWASADATTRNNETVD